MARRAKTSTPPKPESEILANARNNCSRSGGATGLLVSTGTAAGGESGGMSGFRTKDIDPPTGFLADSGAATANRNPNAAPIALFSLSFAPYIGEAGSPAMEINGRRNKPFGPGGSTRRLHQSPRSVNGLRRGRNRIDEGVKGSLFPGIVPPLSGYAIVANDNYAPVAQAA